MDLQIPHDDYLRVKVIPKSVKNEVSEIMVDHLGDKTIKIRVKAAPEKGRANKELIEFLSVELGVNKSKISIISGASDQLKLIKIQW